MCVTPSRRRSSRNTSAMKWGPLSDRYWWCAPKRPKCLRSQADKAVASVVWYYSTQRVKVSTTTRMKSWSGNEPMKSILRHSIGVYAKVVESWAWMGIFNMFIYWQQGQWTCCRWYSLNLTIIALEASVMNYKFLWSVPLVKKRSCRSDCKYIQE